MKRRRNLILALAAGALTAPFWAFAQAQPKVWRVGLFHVGLDHVPPSLDGLREGLKELGYDEGRNILLDWHNLPDEAAARATAQAFVRDKVDLIVAFESQCASAAFEATREIPVVILGVADPVASGYVRSLAHPGGNITGLVASGDTPDKEMELFKELVPGLKHPLVLHNGRDPASERWMVQLRKAAPVLKLKFTERKVAVEADVERAFRDLKPGQVDGVFIASPHLRVMFPSLIIDLATRRRLPVAGHREEWVERGALFSYSPDQRTTGRAAAGRYVDRILKGTKPADLPVEQIAQYRLVVNGKIAKAYGIRIPPSILVRADKVIE